MRAMLLFLLVLPSLTQYSHQSSSLVNSTWMGALDDGIPLKKLSILGTHSSMGTGAWGDAFQTQASSLLTQLTAGMRLLDIRCRHLNNAFPLYDRIASLNTDLGAVLAIVQGFLASNPSETVLIHIVEEGSPSGNSQTFQQTFQTYQSAYSSLIWTPTTQNPSLGMVRGQVVIIQDFMGSQIHGLLFSTFTVLPHKWFNTNWDLYDKWLAVKNFLIASSDGAPRISFWTGHGGSFPYFVASGQWLPYNGAALLSTGEITPVFSNYPDFPRVACFLGMCTIAFEGINFLGYKYIVNNNIKYVGWVFTDFFGDNLLTKVTSSNSATFGKCTALQISRGCTYCSVAGTCLGCNTVLNYVYDPIGLSCLASVGYYLDSSYIPALCSTVLLGCLQCSSGSVCSICDSYSHYQLLGNGTCGAAVGYYLNPTPVACSLTGCTECTSATVCIICTAADNFLLDPVANTCYCDGAANFVLAGSACICTSGFYLDPTNSCSPVPICSNPGCGCLTCDLLIPSCTLCDASSFFVQSGPLCLCDTSYYFNGTHCLSCNASLTTACLTCANAALCLTCTTNFILTTSATCACIPQYYLSSPSTCSQCPIGCLDCTNATVCLLCDKASNFVEVTGVCTCLLGMFLNGTLCQVCGAMAGCLTCTMSGCTSCDSTFGFTLSSAACVCNYGFFINTMEVCEACTMLGCVDCTTAANCTTCNALLFYLSNNTCLEICGDGVLYNLQCDDGNLINGDGCSSTCFIEQDYTCIGGDSISPSACSYSGPVLLTVVSVQKNPLQNTVYVTATIFPVLSSMVSLTFDNLFTPNFPFETKTTSFDSTTGVISQEFTYNTSLNTIPLSVSFVPPATPQFYYMHPVSASFPTTSNNLALKYYDPSFYGATPLIETIVSVLAYLAVGAFVLCLFVSRLMAVEMMLLFQVGSGGLVMLQKLEVYMMPLRKLSIVNGYSILGDSSGSSLPPWISQADYFSGFLANFNLDVIMIVLPLLAGLAFYLYGVARNSDTSKERAVNMMKEWLLAGYLFVTLQLTFSTILAIEFSSSPTGVVIAGVLLIGMLAVSALFKFKPDGFGEFKSFFRDTPACQLFYLVVIVFRLSLAATMVAFCGSNVAAISALSLVVVELAILIFLRPYITNVRPIVNGVFLTIIAAIFLCCRLEQDSTDINVMSYMPLALIGTLLIALLFNVGCIIVHIVRECQSRRNKQTSESEFMEKAKYLQQDLTVKNIRERLMDPTNVQEGNPISLFRNILEELRKTKENLKMDQSRGFESPASPEDSPL